MILSPRQRGYIIGLSKRRRIDEGTEAVINLALAGKLDRNEVNLLIDRLKSEIPPKRRQRKKKRKR